MSRIRERMAPLTAIVAAAVLLACLCTVAVAAVALRVDGRLSLPVWQFLVAGGPMALLIAVAGAVVAARFAGALRLLRGDARRRLHDPSAPVAGTDTTKVPPWTGSEMVELARTLDA